MRLLKPNFDLFACGQNCKPAHIISEPFISLSLRVLPLTLSAFLYVTPSEFFASEDAFFVLFFTLCSPPKCEGRERPQLCSWRYPALLWGEGALPMAVSMARLGHCASSSLFYQQSPFDLLALRCSVEVDTLLAVSFCFSVFKCF